MKQLALAAAIVAFGFEDALSGVVVAFVFAVALAAGWSAWIGHSVVTPLHARHRLGQPILVATVAVSVSATSFSRLHVQAVSPRLPAMGPLILDLVLHAHRLGDRTIIPRLDAERATPEGETPGCAPARER